jgi:hypothetical protein
MDSVVEAPTQDPLAVPLDTLARRIIHTIINVSQVSRSLYNIERRLSLNLMRNGTRNHDNSAYVHIRSQC